MKPITILSEPDILAALNQQQNPFFNDYLAFYSSWFGGIVTNPRLMVLPIDDHIVHRGDGVFEAMKMVDGGIYLYEEHMARLKLSADAIDLKLPFTFDEMKEIIFATLRAAKCNDAIVRLFVSRGPGNFSVNPYDTVGSQFYVVILALHSMPEEKYRQGVSLCNSSIPVKPSWMARVKSCNYLPNVMMKKEAVDRDFDFSINFDDQGFVAEGATENVMIVSQAGTIVHPQLDNILKGTVMLRVCELARAAGMKAEAKAISRDDFLAAREVMMCGTTLDVLPVTKFEDQIIGSGKVGLVAQQLRKLVLEDIKTGPRRVLIID